METIRAHITETANSSADRVIASQRPTTDRVEGIANVVVDGKAPPRAEGQSAQERLAQIRQTKSTLTTEADSLREERKNDRVRAAEEREARMTNVQRARKERTAKKRTAVADTFAEPVDLTHLFHKGFVQGEVLESTWAWLQTQKPYIVRFNEAFKSPVRSRPKINWALKNAEGY